jgi:hypothetical protein
MAGARFASGSLLFIIYPLRFTEKTTLRNAVEKELHSLNGSCEALVWRQILLEAPLDWKFQRIKTRAAAKGFMESLAEMAQAGVANFQGCLGDIELP